MTDVRATVEIHTHGPAIIAQILGNVIRGQNKAGERLLGLSAEQVPLDTGDLMGSGQVVNAEAPGEDTLVVYDRPQAARLHEHPEYNFQNGRKGKYLEDPAVQNRGELGDIIRTEAGRA